MHEKQLAAWQSFMSSLDDGEEVWGGIDPGASGAIAAIAGNSRNAITIDMPVMKIPRKQKGKKDGEASRPDYDGLLAILDAMSGLNVFWSIEQALAVTARLLMQAKGNPMRAAGLIGQAAAGGYRAAMFYYPLEALFAARRLPYESHAPLNWKKAMKISGKTGKDASLILARRLFPEIQLLKSHHNRAEALLLAHYGRSNQPGN